MARVKKISGEQFAFDMIRKELDIIGSGLHFANPDELREWAEINSRWFADYKFSTVEQYLEWRDYFAEHYYDMEPKRVSKNQMKRDFAWFNLNYGLAYDFDLAELKDHDIW